MIASPPTEVGPGSTASPDPLAHLGAGFLGLGLALRLLLPEEPAAAPVIQVLAQAPLLAGSAVVILAGWLRGCSPPAVLWCIPLAALLGRFPQSALSVARSWDLFTASVAGIALRHLVIHHGFGASLTRGLLVLGVLLSLVAGAQVAWQRDELREYVATLETSALHDGAGPAFLASQRASGSLTNPNSLAGLLLLLIPLAAEAALKKRRGIIAIAGTLAAGFVMAGSAGATLAGLLAASVRWRQNPWFKTLGVMGGLSAALLAIGVLGGVDLPVIGEKIETFRLRIDYQRLGVRCIQGEGLWGTGLESTRELRWAYAIPEEAHSGSLHQTWLQLLLELGLPGALLLAAGFGLGRRPRTGPREPILPIKDAAFWGPLLFGCSLAPVLSGVSRIFPLSWEVLWADALLCLGLGSAVLAATRSVAAASPAWVSLGLLAFVLHGFVDFDLYAPAAATTWAACLALCPRSRATSLRTDRVASGLASLALLAAPLLLASESLRRDAATWARQNLAEGQPTTAAQKDAFLGQVDPPNPMPDPDVFSALAERWSASDPATFQAAWERLTPTTRRLPSYGLARALHLAEAAPLLARAGSDATAFYDELEALARAGGALEAPIRWQGVRAASRAGDPVQVRVAAERGLLAAERWGASEKLAAAFRSARGKRAR